MSHEQAGPLVSTFSIIGYDPDAPAWGIAVASKFLAVGARTCWGASGQEGSLGVSVVQAHLNADNGREAVELIKSGAGAEEVLQRLMEKDPYRDLRQQAVIDGQGHVATYTGKDCVPWAGGILGEHCAAQGNMLLNGDGCRAMVDHFASSKEWLARRLVDALALGDEQGGDSRGRQSAALYMVRPLLGERYDVFSEPTIDLRVDDAENPHSELSRLLDIYELVYWTTAADERLPLNEKTLRRCQAALAKLGFYKQEPNGHNDAAFETALQAAARRENLRRRVVTPLEWIDARALAHLERKAGIASG
jgi:uncharacterized Ntn-hydrolase superfamily protein